MRAGEGGEAEETGRGERWGQTKAQKKNRNRLEGKEQRKKRGFALSPFLSLSLRSTRRTMVVSCVFLLWLSLRCWLFAGDLGKSEDGVLRERERERRKKGGKNRSAPTLAFHFFFSSAAAAFACAPFSGFSSPALVLFHSPWPRAATSGMSRPRNLSRRTPRTCAPTTR